MSNPWAEMVRVPPHVERDKGEVVTDVIFGTRSGE